MRIAKRIAYDNDSVLPFWALLLQKLFTGKGEEVGKALAVLVCVVAGDTTQVVAAEMSPLGVILNEVLLGLEALHGLNLLLIDLGDVDEAAGDEFAELGLVELKAEETHLLGGLGVFNAVADGIGVDGGGKDELGDGVVVGIQDILCCTVIRTFIHRLPGERRPPTLVYGRGPFLCFSGSIFERAQ